MKNITFKDTSEYEIKAMDSRYLICARSYTVAERDAEIKEWSDGLSEAVEEEFEADTRGCESFEEFRGNFEWEVEYAIDNGNCPEELSEDTFCYTIVDLQANKRAPDNYGCKFDYNKKEECMEALAELNSAEMELSRRNSIELSEYEIKDD